MYVCVCAHGGMGRSTPDRFMTPASIHTETDEPRQFETETEREMKENIDDSNSYNSPIVLSSSVCWSMHSKSNSLRSFAKSFCAFDSSVETLRIAIHHM